MKTILYDLRKRTGLTQQELAQATGKARALITDMENGRRPITAKTAMKLAGPLGVNWFEIIDAGQSTTTGE